MTSIQYPDDKFPADDTAAVDSDGASSIDTIKALVIEGAAQYSLLPPTPSDPTV